MNRDLQQQPAPADAPAEARSDADLDLAIQGFRGPPEEIERQWFEKIYTGRGDCQRQLTLRAVLMGGVLGMFMSISNLYTTLKLSWAFGVAITACVLSYVIWNGLRGLSRGRLSQMSVLENNCMQSTASAAVWNRASKKASALYSVPVASGLIAGESLVAALIAIACTVVGLVAVK